MSASHPSGAGLPPVFVISLPDAQARREALAARLGALGIAFRFFDGVDGRAMTPADYPDYDALRRRLFFGKDLTPGEMGCLLSHRALYEMMAAQNIARAVVLEDDVIPQPDFAQVLAALADAPVAWDVVRFIGKDKVYANSRDVAALDGMHRLIRPLGTPGGTYGYALTLRAAQAFLGQMRRNWLPVDTLHGFVWRTGLEVYAVRPSPVLHDDGVPSTIGDARFDKTARLGGWQGAVYPLTRFYFKISHLAHTRLAARATRARDVDAGRRKPG